MAYKVETNPLAAVKACDGSAIERYLEAQLAKGLTLVAVAEYAGTPHWIFSVSAPARPAKSERT